MENFAGSKGVSMEYQVFLANVKERLKEELHGQVRVEDYRTLKNNGEERQGFVFQTEKEGISPVIYMEEYYERYLHGMEMERVIDSLINWYEHARQIPDPVMGAEHLRDFERIRKKIVYRIINTERNRKILTQVPHLPYLDLSVVFYVQFSVQKYSAISMLITNGHLSLWGIAKEEIIQAARWNTPRLLPAEIADVQNLVLEMFPGYGRSELLHGLMYVQTNMQRNYGAAVLLYPGLLEMIGEEWKENFYILPSSIHEVLLVPESKNPGLSELKEAVFSINRTEVTKEEFLSDTVYYYNCRKKELCM